MSNDRKKPERKKPTEEATWEPDKSQLDRIEAGENPEKNKRKKQLR